MERIKKFIFDTCPKTGRIKGIKAPAGIAKLFIPLTGLIALIWILIRVIPKPSRINYPCIKTAVPFAANFIFYLVALSASIAAFTRTKRPIIAGNYFFAAAFLSLGAGATFYTYQNINQEPVQFPTSFHASNLPVGEAKGIFPGRVVWIFNPRAVNQNCNPSSWGHSWFMPENNNQPVIDSMLSTSLQLLTGKQSDTSAWSSVFMYHNKIRGKGAAGYKKGEKIFIKINATSTWSGNFKTSDLSIVNNSYYGISETSPALIIALLRQLVYKAGADQKDIYIGDPMKHIYKHFFDQLKPEFPNIHYLDHDGYAGREIAEKSQVAVIYFSDKGTVLKSGGTSGLPVYYDYLYKIFNQAEYVLNVPMLKGHRYAGITMFAKNHFGSHTENDATHLHNGLVSPEPEKPTRTGYGLYRVQVDLMGSNLLNEKNLFYLCDALWGTEYELAKPVKWEITPFNNRFSSSILLSFDPVAIESAGFDFLRSEFTTARGLTTYAQMEGVDDYLHQAADTTARPKNIFYDPNLLEKQLPSLGVHEHWNNQTDKKYSRNLGTGLGIELKSLDMTTDVKTAANEIPNGFELFNNYPNPFNPVTKISFSLPAEANVLLKVYDLSGREIKTLVNCRMKPGVHEVNFNAAGFSSGVYLYKLTAGRFTAVKKLTLIK